MLVVYAKSAKAKERLAGALNRQGIEYVSEKHNLPMLQWVFMPTVTPKLKNMEDLIIMDLPITERPACLRKNK